ncbi:uncharacterized protein K489DRAFT_398204 [Dissoconium aciculare CBS 342.82]|uniref:Uncharacterized protein n=1 Tax=Dissoconium aciculare CBS 342.82 TaxID=1314786 RepID=A0A6J3MCR5_9PEZI|nr:uncharacterized protein K489DRAFT_398204 [Dissoconium aciculare CBS 342.82]KAF1825816.1 hypothetical protein K489DRAFT_398204 [Dissoconium aciculare CBS 342.82]
MSEGGFSSLLSCQLRATTPVHSHLAVRPPENFTKRTFPAKTGLRPNSPLATPACSLAMPAELPQAKRTARSLACMQGHINHMTHRICLKEGTKFMSSTNRREVGNLGDEKQTYLQRQHTTGPVRSHSQLDATVHLQVTMGGLSIINPSLEGRAAFSGAKSVVRLGVSYRLVSRFSIATATGETLQRSYRRSMDIGSVAVHAVLLGTSLPCGVDVTMISVSYIANSFSRELPLKRNVLN